MKYVLSSLLIIALGLTACAQMALRGGVGSAPEAKDMALVGSMICRIAPLISR